MKTQDIFEAIRPFLLPLLAPILTAIGSKLTTDNWGKWFFEIPMTGWIMFALFMILWVVFARVRQIKKPAAAVCYTVYNPIFGWIPLRKRKYAGVLWQIRAPRPRHFLEIENPQISPSDIDIERPPRCPECETEIEESPTFWGKYIWRCIGCGFKKKNGDSYATEAARVGKLARREWEKRVASK